MNATEAYAALEASRRPVVTTSQAALVWGVELSSAAHLLSRLAAMDSCDGFVMGSGALDKAARTRGSSCRS